MVEPQLPSPLPNRSAVGESRQRGIRSDQRAQRTTAPAACRRCRSTCAHVRQRRDLVGLARGVAAGDDDARGGIVARDPSNGLPRALIGGCGHRAGVDDHDVCGSAVGRLGSSRQQLFLEAERVGLVDPAAERHDRILHQVTVMAVARIRPAPAAPCGRCRVRYCMPSKLMCADAGVGARDRLA